MKRKVDVEATVHFEFEIDDEAVSDWDGATILTVLEKRGKGNDIYTERATLRELLGFLGIQLAVEGRSMGSFDGWADFPADAAFSSQFGVSWDIDSVMVQGDDGWTAVES